MPKTIKEVSRLMFHFTQLFVLFQETQHYKISCMLCLQNNRVQIIQRQSTKTEPRRMASVSFTFRHIRRLKYALATTFIAQICLAPGEQIIKFCLKFFRANCRLPRLMMRPLHDTRTPQVFSSDSRLQRITLQSHSSV